MGDPMMKRLSLVVVLASLLFSSNAAEAQLRRVLDLNRQAMDAYNNLEIEQAMQTLQEALQNAQRNGVTGAPLGRTYLNLGVVAIGGFGDNGQGLQFFVSALQADRTVQLDPLTSTPDIQSVFALAQSRAGSGGGTPTTPTDPTTTTTSTPAPPGTIPHRPHPEQLTNTALPVFVEAPDDAPVGAIYAYYKAPGMRDFRRMDMRRVTGGYGVEIPCGEVMAPRVQYYIVAFDTSGAPMGFAGSAEEPFSVSIVTARTQPAPALPGQAPPEQCTETECPPGMPGCTSGRGNAGLGDTCRSTQECRAGLVCDDEFCVADAGDGGGGGSSEPGEFSRFFLEVGFNIGLGVVKSGMPVDRIPSDPANAANLGYFEPGSAECNADVAEDGYCLNLVANGVALAPGIEIHAGGWLHSRIALGVFARIAVKAGEGSLSRILFGGRVSVRLTRPTREGFEAVAYLGGGGGQYQVQAPDTEPFAISGLVNLHLGLGATYRFTPNVGVFARFTAHIMLPTSLFAMDPTLGLQVAF